MNEAGLEEAQAGIKIARININNLKYADNTTLMAENKEEVKSVTVSIVSPTICHEVMGPDATIFIF